MLSMYISEETNERISFSSGLIEVENISGHSSLTQPMFRTIGRSFSISVSPANYMHYVRKYASLYEHYRKLLELKGKGLINDETLTEILKQHELFLDIDEQELSRNQGKFVVMCNGEMFLGSTLNKAVEMARAKYGNRPYYSEAINLIEIPSILPSGADSIS